MLPYLLVLLPIALILVFTRALRPAAQSRIALLSVIPITVFAGLRGYVGIDTYMYHKIFYEINDYSFSESLSQIEPIFVFAIRFVHFFSNNSFFFTGLIAVIQGIILVKLIQSSKDPLGLMLLYVSIFYLSFEFNILRAGTAILFLILASRQLHYSNKKKFYGYSILACFSHYSAVLGFIPMIFSMERSFKVRLLLTLVIILGIFGGYLFLIQGGLAPQKYLNYLIMDLHAETQPSFFGLGIRICLYLGIYSSIVTKDNVGILTTIILTWLFARILTIEYVFVDRVEIIFNALFVFYAIEQHPVRGKKQIFLPMLGLMVILGLYSNLKGLTLSEEELARGLPINDLTHTMSPYIPYRYLWQESRP